MPRGDRSIVLRHLNTLFSVGMIGDPTDAQLLEGSRPTGTETAELAFAGGWSAATGRWCCASVRAVLLRDAHDADDAFQATFPDSGAQGPRRLWVRDSLGPWLHEVAYRTASWAPGSTAVRRRQHELRAAEMTARPPENRDAMTSVG